MKSEPFSKTEQLSPSMSRSHATEKPTQPHSQTDYAQPNREVPERLLNSKASELIGAETFAPWLRAEYAKKNPVNATGFEDTIIEDYDTSTHEKNQTSLIDIRATRLYEKLIAASAIVDIESDSATKKQLENEINLIKLKLSELYKDGFVPMTPYTSSAQIEESLTLLKFYIEYAHENKLSESDLSKRVNETITYLEKHQKIETLEEQIANVKQAMRELQKNRTHPGLLTESELENLSDLVAKFNAYSNDLNNMT